MNLSLAQNDHLLENHPANVEISRHSSYHPVHVRRSGSIRNL